MPFHLVDRFFMAGYAVVAFGTGIREFELELIDDYFARTLKLNAANRPKTLRRKSG